MHQSSLETFDNLPMTVTRSSDLERKCFVQLTPTNTRLAIPYNGYQQLSKNVCLTHRVSNTSNSTDTVSLTLTAGQ